MFKPLRFAVLKNKAFVGYVNGTSQRDANRKAKALYGRCECMLDKSSRGMGVIGRVAHDSDASYSDGRRPYATPGFADRRAAEIAAWKAANA